MGYFISRAPLILLICILLSCSSSPIYYDVGGVSSLINKKAPLRVAILPFENLTSEPNWEDVLRVSFYNHFSSKNYIDIELNVVDRAISSLEKSTGKGFREISNSRLGEVLNADILIYGRLNSYNRYFLGLYSQISITVQVELVDAKTGNVIWKRSLTKRSHEGGVPFSLFGIIPSAIRSGYHMKKEKTVELIEKINRELVASIPDALPIEEDIPVGFKIQVASFMDESLAKRTRDKLKDLGFNPAIESALVGGRIWHRVILGPYKDIYVARKRKKEIEEAFSYKPIIIKNVKKKGYK